MIDIADRAVLNHLFGKLNGGYSSVVVTDDMSDTGGLDRVVHGARFGHGEG